MRTGAGASPLDGLAECPNGHRWPARLVVGGKQGDLEPDSCKTCGLKATGFRSAQQFPDTGERGQPIQEYEVGAKFEKPEPSLFDFSMLDEPKPEPVRSPPIVINVHVPTRWFVLAMVAVIIASMATCMSAVIGYADTVVQYGREHGR